MFRAPTSHKYFLINQLTILEEKLKKKKKKEKETYRKTYIEKEV